MALEFIPRREVRGVWTTVAERHAKALSVADDDVSAPFARRCQQHQTQNVRRDRDQRIGGVKLLDCLGVVDHGAIGRRILHQRAEHVRLDSEVRVAGDPHFDPAHAGAGLHHVDRLRMALGCHEEDFLSGFPLERVAHRHRFGGGGCFVEQRRVGDLQPGEVDHHRLEIEQRFEPALCDLRLIRRVRGVPARILEDVSLNHRRRHAIGVAHADERAEDLVLRRQRPEVGENFELGQPLREIEALAPANPPRDCCLYQLIERREAERFQHLGDVFLVGSYMSWNEGFSGGNRSFNVLDCGTHRSDNLTSYAPPAKLRPLASSPRSTSHWR